MAIYKNKRRKGFVYRVRVQLGGNRVSRSFTKNLDAIEYQRTVKIDSSFVEESEIKFADAAPEWIQNHAKIKNMYYIFMYGYLLFISTCMHR